MHAFSQQPVLPCVPRRPHIFLRAPSECNSEGAPSESKSEGTLRIQVWGRPQNAMWMWECRVKCIQINLEDIFKTQSQKQNVAETNVETSWGRADPSSDKPKLARIEVVFIFEMVHPWKFISQLMCFNSFGCVGSRNCTFIKWQTDEVTLISSVWCCARSTMVFYGFV